MKKCKSCGQAIKDGNTFCGQCGAHLEETESVSTAHSNKGIIVVAIAAALAVALVATFAIVALVIKDEGVPVSLSKSREAFPYHVVTADYEFDIPEYWRGKVSYVNSTDKHGYSQTTIFLAGHLELNSGSDYKYSLATVTANPENKDIGGDIGNHKVCDASSDGKYVSVWTKCWPLYAWESARSGSPTTSKYDQSLVIELVDLSTGGAVSYEQAIKSQNSGFQEEVDFNEREFKKTLRIVD